MHRPTALLHMLLALLLAVGLPTLAVAQVVVLDDEVVLSERPRGGGNSWEAPVSVLPSDQGALASELYGILQSQPPLLPARVTLPSRATLDVTAYPSLSRRTGLPCIGCRNPCRSFRYTYARPDQGSVTVEGKRCRRRNGQWVAFEPDAVIAQRPGAPGAPGPSALRGAPAPYDTPRAQSSSRAVPPPLPPARPGDGGPVPAAGGGTVAAADGGTGDATAPSPWDPPSTVPSDPATADGSTDPYSVEDTGPDAGQDFASLDQAPPTDAWSTSGEADEPVPPDVGQGAGDGPLVLTPPGQEETAPVDTTAGQTEPPASSAVEAARAALATDTADTATEPETTDAPAADAAATEPPVESTPTAPSATPTADVETQTARVVVPYGGTEKEATAIDVETMSADPQILRMLRMLRYLDPETSEPPSPEVLQAAISDFATDERFALPVSDAELRKKLEGAVDRLAALSSCPATGADGDYGVCLTKPQ